MENNSIPPVFYEKLVNKYRTIKLFYFLFILFSIWFLFFTNYCNNISVVIFSCLLVACIIWAFIIYGNSYRDDFLKEIAKVYNFSYDQSHKSKEISWDCVKELEKFSFYYGTDSLYEEIVFSGDFCNRGFNFYTLLAGYKHPELWFEIQTGPIKGFSNNIFIAPKKFSLRKIVSNLPKVKIDTRNVCEIYTDNPQSIKPFISKEFIETFRDYGQNIYILITPKGVILMQRTQRDFFFFVLSLFSTKKQVLRNWQQVENFLKLLDLINLLEKK